MGYLKTTLLCFLLLVTLAACAAGNEPQETPTAQERVITLEPQVTPTTIIPATTEAPATASATEAPPEPETEPPTDAYEPDEPCEWELYVDSYRAFIENVILLWDCMDADAQQEARDIITENGVAFMDEITARRLGLWHGYPEPPFTDRDIDMIARTVWGEARGCTPAEQRLVVWTILQRVDCPRRWGNTIESVVTARRQFAGYRITHPICPEIHALVYAELIDWRHGAEPPTLYPFAPTLPYYFFCGDGQHNWFRAEW